MANVEDLRTLPLERLDILQDHLRLVGLVLGQLALLEVVVDEDAPANSRVQAARCLTEMGGDPQTIIERLKASPFVDKSPEELRKMIQDLRDGEIELDQLTTGD